MCPKNNEPLSDKELFQQAMQGVKPLKAELRVDIPKPRPVTKRQMPIQPEIPLPMLSSYYAEPVAVESILSYAAEGLNPQTLRRLRLGEIHIAARLDLHGLRPEAAEIALCQFIQQQFAAERRELLIIHGKGGQTQQAPRLKNLVNCWLRQLPEVLAFHSAKPQHGGAGALYVLLRKGVRI